ncbi:hypothetical protein M408DRAFT_9738 [Serendipita vermifera MAFF 305830]|uniref:Uncharacterized protein n=1 Tax=Serendipita vermifera MAFF 305830 TaxID=933852 RepID=A0A0C3AQ42_SERVB|nr:hypothetical protein M408DRAFT_9738 [Serendipita vermifera MAFF 305830]
MPRLRSPSRVHCVRKKISYLAIKVRFLLQPPCPGGWPGTYEHQWLIDPSQYESDSRRSSISEPGVDTEVSSISRKKVVGDVKAEARSPRDIKIERAPTPNLLHLKNILVPKSELPCAKCTSLQAAKYGTVTNVKAEIEPGVKAEDLVPEAKSGNKQDAEKRIEIKTEKESPDGLGPGVKVGRLLIRSRVPGWPSPWDNTAYRFPSRQCFKLDSKAQLVETYEPVTGNNRHFEGPWPSLEEKIQTARWSHISRLVIITPDSLALYTGTLIELPRCTSFHMNTCHPADLLSFDLPMVDYLGLVARDIKDSTNADEVQSFTRSSTVAQMRPSQLFLALPVDEVNYGILLHILGKEAITVKVTMGPDSYMGHVLFDGLCAPSQHLCKGPSPALLPKARNVLFDVTQCSGYSDLACETASEVLRLAADIRSGWASERVVMRLA